MISSRYIWPLCNLRLFPYLRASPQIQILHPVNMCCVLAASSMDPRTWCRPQSPPPLQCALSSAFLVAAADEPRQPQFLFTAITFWWLDLFAATLESLYDFSRISLLFIQFPVKPDGCFYTFGIWETGIHLFTRLIKLLVLPNFFFPIS